VVVACSLRVCVLARLCCQCVSGQARRCLDNNREIGLARFCRKSRAENEPYMHVGTIGICRSS